jgi:cell division protein ZapE
LDADEDLTMGELSGIRSAVLVPLRREELRPPPRFDEAAFTTYRIDETVPGQSAAVEAVRSFAAGPQRRWFGLRADPRQPGLYLDGGFGVGKTHLLAAAWHAAPGQRVYLSFAEAMSLMTMLSPSATVELLAADLVCIDEFELDDPSNTRLSDLLLDGLAARGCRIMVTSNTVPGELGAGRLFIDQFKAQLVRIAERFAAITVPGRDYRQRLRGHDGADPRGWGPQAQAFPAGSGTVQVAWPDLDRFLADLPIINLRRLAAAVRRLTITGVATIPDQISALRFVHLVDRLYDHRVALRIQATCPIAELFHPDWRDWAFAKKYRRCTSRLTELCGEDIR